jgi:CD109 antigen
VKAGQAKSVYFPIVPATLGQLSITVKAQTVMAADAVKRQLLVEDLLSPKHINKNISIQYILQIYKICILYTIVERYTFNIKI